MSVQHGAHPNLNKLGNGKKHLEMVECVQAFRINTVDSRYFEVEGTR